MFWALIFIVEFVLLFFLSQELTKHLSALLLTFTKNQKITVYIMAILFFPGVLIHELSHLIFANMLFVKTGEIEFFPQVDGDHVKLGSVAIAATDPFRRFFIGVAPVIAGVFVMFVLSYYLLPAFPAFNWQTFILIYSFFEIGNTMFSSKKDMEGAFALLVAVGILVAAFYFIGLRTQVNFLALVNTASAHFFLQNADGLLFLPLITNICLLLAIKLVFKK